MMKHAPIFAAMAALLTVGACNQGTNDGQSAQTPAAQKAAGNKTIAAGLAQNGRFMAAARAAGLDQTLAGPGPYTVLVPDDAAFGQAPAGMLDAKPENRTQLMGVLTHMILPGTVLAADIGKAIDASKGKTTLATISGGSITATKEGDKIVLTDEAGHKATIVHADEQYSNGVAHHISALLMPGEESGAKAPAAGNAVQQ